MPTSATDTESPTRVTLLRHGEPVGGPRFRGTTDDPLSPRGWEQMRAAIRAEDRWDVILASPLQRCADFAQELASAQRCPLHLEAAFQELHYGDWEGRTSDALLAEDGERLQAFWADASSVTPPRGEPLAVFEQRVERAWRHWMQQLSGQRVLLITHGGVIRVLLAQVVGATTSRVHRGVAVPYASRSQLRLDHSPQGLLSCLLSHGQPE